VSNSRASAPCPLPLIPPLLCLLVRSSLSFVSSRRTSRPLLFVFMLIGFIFPSHRNCVPSTAWRPALPARKSVRVTNASPLLVLFCLVIASFYLGYSSSFRLPLLLLATQSPRSRFFPLSVSCQERIFRGKKLLPLHFSLSIDCFPVMSQKLPSFAAFFRSLGAPLF